MSTITRERGFRKLGVIESAYLLDDIMVEIIADGKHLPPELLKMICKNIGVDNISLVTDSMRGAGCIQPSFISGNVCNISDPLLVWLVSFVIFLFKDNGNLRERH